MIAGTKPVSEACERNKEPILGVLREVLAQSRRVLEIGSGTGQHAVYFARHLPHVQWQTSDLPAHHPGITAWLQEEGPVNALPPLALDVDAPQWPVQDVDAVFSANTVHIIAWPQVERLFAGVGRVLVAHGLLCLYGPFNYNGAFTSDSNAKFDVWLKERDPRSGIRDFADLDRLAAAQGLDLAQDVPMPSNNRILVWRKRAARVE
jgi:cyclopropane fatty-acyl-phospholipid synthase-like methyltransferase